ncbi:PAS domain-containing protein [Myxosarcina sp. GI1]|uniref:PAS domain-containing protein n=1 Tax=Myxosarcina sp. GI1 TaxID=1541065 RepID=UPI000691E368|nr:PAS domain-containing protein [Myxosarcina sp. GI1]
MKQSNSRQRSSSFSAAGLLFLLADGTIRSCNPDAELILGYTAKQLIGTSLLDPIWQMIHRDGSTLLPKNHPAIASIKTGQPCSNVVAGFYKPSGLIWLSIDCQPLFLTNQPQAYGIEISFREISQPTEAAVMPQTLLKKTSNVEPSEDTKGQVTVLLVEDFSEDREMYRRYLQANSEHKYNFVEAETGESALEIARQCQPDIILLDYLLPDMDGLELLASWQRQNSPLAFPVIVLTGEGNENIAVQFLKLGAANYLIKRQLTPEKLKLEVNRAISEHHLQLQHDETLLKLQLATEASGVGLWFWDLIDERLEFTDRCKALFGFAPNTETNYQLFLNTLHPEDRDRTDTAVQQALANKTEYSIEYRAIWSDGSIHWLAARGRGFYDCHGEPVRMMGTVQDISQRKQIEQSLLESSQRIVDILESMTDAFYTLDRDFNFTYLNQEAARVLGKSKEELIGQNLWTQFSPLVGTELELQYRHALVQKTATCFEYYYPPFKSWYEISVYPTAAGLSIYFRDITDSKLAVIRLRKNERLLKLALSSAKAGSWDWEIATGKIIWSPENYELYGIDPQRELLEYRDWQNSVHPEDRERSNWEVQQTLSGKSSEFRTEFRIVHPKKGIRWVSGIGNVTRNERGEPMRLSGINLDITESKLKEYELRLITEVIPQQIWTALPDGKVEYTNQRWQDYTGVSLEEIKEKGLAAIVHPDDLESVERAWNDSIQTGKKYNLEARLCKADGTYCWFLGKARALRDDGGKIIRWYGTNTDITSIKELEEKLRQQTEDLIRANQLKDEFLAIVSHELRTPLNPILGWSQLLATGKLPPEQTAKGLDTITRNAKLQSQLIDDLLDMSLILRGKLALKLVPTNLKHIIKVAKETVKLAAEAKSIQIQTVFEPNIGLVLGDLTRLQQIFWNLLNNAIKFTPEGGLVTIALECNKTHALVRISDTGKGIDPKFLPYVFDRFRQEESSYTRHFGGLGLGLAIVRHLTELHDGTVIAESLGIGRGATFKVTIPLINPLPTEPQHSDPTEPTVETNRFNGIKVLVIEDEVDSRELLSLVLELRGAEIVTVASANEALEVLSELVPDLIISDIGLPGMDGYTLITQIRSLPQGQDIPAIALTAYTGEIDRQRCLNAGFQEQISKPFNVNELIATVTRLMSKKS